MTVKQRLSRSNIYMFLIPLLIAAALLLVGTGIALYVLETVYQPKIGLSLRKCTSHSSSTSRCSQNLRYSSGCTSVRSVWRCC